MTGHTTNWSITTIVATLALTPARFVRKSPAGFIRRLYSPY